MRTGNDFWKWWINNDGSKCNEMVVRLLIGACLAFGLEVSEYFAVYKTSSITLAVVGVIKVCMTYSVYFYYLFYLLIYLLGNLYFDFGCGMEW